MKLIKELYTTKEYNDGAVFTSMNYPDFEDIVPEKYFFQGPDKILKYQKKSSMKMVVNIFYLFQRS